HGVADVAPEVAGAQIRHCRVQDVRRRRKVGGIHETAARRHLPDREESDYAGDAERGTAHCCHGSSESRSGASDSVPKSTAASPSVSIDARSNSARYVGSVIFCRVFSSISVYVPTMSRTSSGCASAYSIDFVIAEV